MNEPYSDEQPTTKGGHQHRINESHRTEGGFSYNSIQVSGSQSYRGNTLRDSDVLTQQNNYNRNDAIPEEANEDEYAALGEGEEFAGYAEEPFDPDQMTPEELEALTQPTSTRLKRVIKYEKDLRRYNAKDEDFQEMIKYGIDVLVFQKLTAKIVDDVNLRPFDKRLPLHRKLLLYLAAFFVFAIYIYLSFLLLQLALFNLILLGILIIYMGKLYDSMTKFAFKYDYNYRNEAFQKHIKAANDTYFIKHNVELVGLQEGLWLELQFPDNEDVSTVGGIRTTAGGENLGSLKMEPQNLIKVISENSARAEADDEKYSRQ
jgi:hypothetical protein